VREYQILREQIFAYLEDHASQFARSVTAGVANINYRVGIALDEAMRETISAFVEEHIVQLRRLSRLDSVTGLYNHRIFYERLEDELNRAKRYDSPLTLVLIDLDNFKTVNDTKGHPFGDHLLVKCAECLRHELRQTDIICRYGGDEFGIILTETTRQHGHGMMVRLSNAIRELGIREGAPASFGMSFGLAAHPEDDGTVTGLVKASDDHLLYNKHMNKVGLAETRKGSL
jgi:diguanylate cyclase (GGDEF)-like protein